MKKLAMLLGVVFLVLVAAINYSLTSKSYVSAINDEKVITYFHGEGCPHCAEVDSWMDSRDIEKKYPIDNREIYNNGNNATFFNEMMDRLAVPLDQRGVPAVVIGDTVLVGDKSIIDNFKKDADKYLNTTDTKVGDDVTRNTTPYSKEKLTIWVLVSASLVDAINPCAFAVLIILLTTILLKRNKKTALLSGFSFSLAIFISYVLMGLGLYGAISAAGISDLITNIVGILALILGVLNLKDYFWYGKITLIEVPRKWRPAMIGLIQKTTNPIGVFFVGLIVSLFLLPCTSGPYIVVLGLLAQNPLDAQAIGYLILYNLIFVSPMILITIAAYNGLNVEKLEKTRKNNLRLLHLIAGCILVSLGLYVLFI